MRGAMTSASFGSRPTRICSKPRNIVPTHHASVTVCPASSSRTSMSPSTRLRSMWITRRSGGTPHLAMLEERLGERELRADAAVAGVADLVSRAAAPFQWIGEAWFQRGRAADAIELQAATLDQCAHRLDHRRGVYRASAQIDHR